jgi:hypothetical protein
MRLGSELPLKWMIRCRINRKLGIVIARVVVRAMNNECILVEQNGTRLLIEYTTVHVAGLLKLSFARNNHREMDCGRAIDRFGE